MLGLVAASLASGQPHQSSSFGCGKLYYRTLYLDERSDALYVGAMDRVLRLDARNVSRSDCEADTMYMEATAVAECVGKGKSKNTYQLDRDFRICYTMEKVGTPHLNSDLIESNLRVRGIQEYHRENGCPHQDLPNESPLDMSVI